MTSLDLTMMEELGVELVFLLSLVVASNACQVGQSLLQQEIAAKDLNHGEYIGIKQDLLSLNSQLCFYVPAVTDECLTLERFLTSCGKHPNCSQYDRKDVVNERDVNETSYRRIVNFRMMEPDNVPDEAFVIRLYNRTVIWLSNGPCSGNEHVSGEWNPRIFSLDDNSPPDCLIPTAIPTTTAVLQNTSMLCDSKVYASDSKFFTPTSTPVSVSVTDTKPTVSDSEGLVSDAEVGGITTGIAIPMLLLGFGLGVLFECSGLRKRYKIKILQRREDMRTHPDSHGVHNGQVEQECKAGEVQKGKAVENGEDGEEDEAVNGRGEVVQNGGRDQVEQNGEAVDGGGDQAV